MQRIIAKPRKQFIAAHHNRHGACLYRNYRIVKPAFFQHRYILHCGFHQSAGAVTEARFYISVQAACIDPDANGNIMQLCTVHNHGNILRLCNIAGVYTKLVRAVLRRCNGKPMIKVYIRYKRDAYLLLYPFYSLRTRHGIHRCAYYITSGLLQTLYLLCRSVNILRACISHGLYRYFILSAYLKLSYIDAPAWSARVFIRQKTVGIIDKGAVLMCIFIC